MQALSRMKEVKWWIWLLAISFVALNAILIAFEVYYLPLLPVAILLFILAFFSLDKLIYAVVFFVPLSIPLSRMIPGLPVDMNLPSEPVLALILLIFALRFLKGNFIDMKVLRHPVTLAVYLYLAWIFVTTIASSNPLVSLKYLLSKFWFIIGFYLLPTQLFRDEKRMRTYVWMYVISFTIVIFYTLVRHAGYGLTSQMMAHSMMQPFYKDHTSYGATLAFLLPVLAGLFLLIRKGDFNNRFLMILLIFIYLMATVFSYTRAAWLSIMAGMAVWLVIWLKIKFEYIAVSAVILLAVVFTFRTQVLMDLEQNRQRSSGDLAEHVQSMANVSTDVSNLERINRWSCALRMWQERPVFGFGPGTYQFEYARFQRSYERTEISTDFGTLGTAHSEYLGPLSEMGLLGLISVLLIVATTIVTGIRVHFTARSRPVRIFSLAVLIGLVTYYVHGVLNNFLDTDKASALFWGYTAMLVAMDVYHRDKKDALERDEKAQLQA